MRQKLISFLLKCLEKITGKVFLYFNRQTVQDFGKTAVKSVFGFWYAGNVLDPNDIAYGILNNGLVEKDETNLVIKILKHINTEKEGIFFYDIGANTGYYGILAAFLGKGKVQTFSFEPVKEYFDCLNENIRLNRLEKEARSFNYALSDTGGKKVFYLAGLGSTLSHDFLGSKDAPQRQVETKRLDDVFSREALLAPDFVKIDVEGHELPVLKGARETLRSTLPVLFVEILRSFAGGDNPNYLDTFNFLSELGYQPYYLEKGKLVAFNPSDGPEGVKMFLFLHPQKHAELINFLITNKVSL